jgi:hypothetical protein
MIVWFYPTYIQLKLFLTGYKLGHAIAQAARLLTVEMTEIHGGQTGTGAGFC